MKRTLAMLMLASAAPALANASVSSPAAPVATAIPAPADVGRGPGGTIALDMDAPAIPCAKRGVPRARGRPLAAGPSRLTLLYPQWLPGNHGPRGPLAELVDLRFSVAGKPVAWRRDPIEVYAFHLDLPAGARELVADSIHTSPLQPSEGRVTMTPEMLNLQWEKMSLYPAGHHVRRIPVRASVTLPPGWSVAGALDGMRQQGDRVSWTATDYEQLVNSPLFAPDAISASGTLAGRWRSTCSPTRPNCSTSPRAISPAFPRWSRRPSCCSGRRPMTATNSSPR